MRRLRNYEDAEDAVQDAMLSAFKNIARFRGHAQMSTWVGAIVINAVRMQLRRRPRYQMASIEQCFEDGRPSPAELLADPRPNPEKALERSEWRELAIRLTAGLSPTQRAALQLRQEDDFSTRNAAAKLGVPEGTLKAQLARGRAKLKKRFQMAMRKPRTQTLKFDLKT
jgi:RNA polymerase sigma-70 factor (ECF subfamily)